MGIDYVLLNQVQVHPSPFPWAVGKDDDDWPAGDGEVPTPPSCRRMRDQFRFREVH